MFWAADKADTEFICCLHTFEREIRNSQICSNLSAQTVFTDFMLHIFYQTLHKNNTVPVKYLRFLVRLYLSCSVPRLPKGEGLMGINYKSRPGPNHILSLRIG